MELETSYFEGRKFLHQKLGDELIQEFHICRIRQHKDEKDEDIKKRDLMFYQAEWGAYTALTVEMLNSLIRQKMNDISISRQREVRRYIEDVASIIQVKYEDLVSAPNVVFSVKNGTFFSHSSSHIITKRIATNYKKEETECAVLDEFMSTITCGNKEIEQLLYEIVGYCLSPTIFIHKFFIIVGEGGNGKSAFLNLLTALLGRWNVGNTPLNKYGGRFELAGMEHIAVNIGDDISNKALLESDNLKKLVSGDPVKVEYKGQQGYTIYPTCKHIFSTNSMLRIIDTTYGIKRRFVAIPFRANLKGKMKPFILKDIIKAGGLPVLLNRALEGLQRLYDNQEFTLCDEVKQETEQRLNETNPIHIFNEMWKNNEFEPYESLTAKEFICVPVEQVPTNKYYKYYKDFCKQYGYEALGITKFNQGMKELGYKIAQRWDGEFIGKRVFEHIGDNATK